MSTSQKIEDEFRPLVEQLGYELVYVEYVKEGPEWYRDTLSIHQME